MNTMKRALRYSLFVLLGVGLWVGLMFPEQAWLLYDLLARELYAGVVGVLGFFIGRRWVPMWNAWIYDKMRAKNELVHPQLDDQSIAVCYKWGSKDLRRRRQCLQLVLMVRRNVGWDHKEFIPDRGPVEHMTEDLIDNPSDDIDMPQAMRRWGFDVQCVKVQAGKLFRAYEIPGDAIGWARFWLKINSPHVKTAEQLYEHLRQYDVGKFPMSANARVIDDRQIKMAIDTGLMTPAEAADHPSAPTSEPKKVVGLGDYRNRGV